MPAKGIWAFPLICGCWDFGAGSPSPTKDNPINVECPKDPQKQDGKASPPQKAQPQRGRSSSMKDPKPPQLPQKGGPKRPKPPKFWPLKVPQISPCLKKPVPVKRSP